MGRGMGATYEVVPYCAEAQRFNSIDLRKSDSLCSIISKEGKLMCSITVRSLVIDCLELKHKKERRQTANT